jgi:hypothetical protein
LAAGKIFRDSVETYQEPQDFDDEGREIETENERENYQSGTGGVKQRVNQPVASYFSGLQQNIGENDYSDTDRTDKVKPGKLHKAS